MARTRRRATTKPGIEQQQGDEEQQQQQVDIGTSQPQEDPELEPSSSQAVTERESVDAKDAQADHAEGPDDATANKSSGSGTGSGGGSSSSALPDTTPSELSETPRRRRTRRAQEASGESAASQEQETAAAAAGSQSADADTAAEAAEAPAAASTEPPRTPGGRRGRKSQQLAASRGSTTPRRPAGAAPETAVAESGEAEGSSVQQTPGTGRKRKRRAAEEVEQEEAEEEESQVQEPIAPAASAESETHEATSASVEQQQQQPAAEPATEQPQQQHHQTANKRKSWFGPRRSISAFFSRSSAPTPAADVGGPSRASADAPDDSISIDEGEEEGDQQQAQKEPQQEQQQPQALVTEEAPPTFSALANAADDISFSSLGEAITHGVANLLPGADSGSSSAAPEASSSSSLERPASEAAAPAPQAPAQLQAPQQPPRQQKRGSLFSTFKDYRERIAGSFKRRRTEIAASTSGSSSSASSNAAQQEASAPAEPETSTPAEKSAIGTSALLESGESNAPTEQQAESTAERLYPSLDGLRQEAQAREGNLPLPPAVSEETKSEEAPRLYPALPTFSFGQTPTEAPETRQEEEKKDESGDVSMRESKQESRSAPAKAATAPSEAGGVSSQSAPAGAVGAAAASEQAATAGPSSSKLTPPRKGPKPPSTMILGSGGKLARGARGRALQLVVEQELSQSQELGQEKEEEREQEQAQEKQEQIAAMQADPEPAVEQPQADSANAASAEVEEPAQEEERPDFIDFDTSRRLIARLDAGRSQPSDGESHEQGAREDSEAEGEEQEEEEILINGSAGRKDQEALPTEKEQEIEEQEDLGEPVSRGSPAPGPTGLANGTLKEPDNFGDIHFDDETGAVTFDAGEEAEEESEAAASEPDEEKENSREEEADAPVRRSRSLSNSPRQPLTIIDLTDDNEEDEEEPEAAASPDVREDEEAEEDDEIILLDARPPARKPSRTQLRGTMRESLERDPDAYFGVDLERSFDRSLRLDTSAIDLVAAIGAPVLYRQNATRVRKARHKSKRDPIFHKEHKLRVARERERTRVNFGARVAKTLKSLGAGTKLPPGFLQMIEKKIKVEHAIQRRGRASAPGDEEGGAAAMGDSSIERIIREMMARHNDASSSIGPSLVKQKEFERYKQAQLAKDRALRGVLGRKPLPDRLTDEQDEVVNAAFKKRGIVAKMPGGEVNNEDMARLRPGCWLNDETINMYGLMILARSKKAAEERAKAKAEGRKCDTQWLCYWDVHFFNSFFYSKVEKEGHSAVKRWTRKIDLFSKDIVLFPVNLGNNHWVAGAINFRRKRIEYYDSMRSYNRYYFDVVREYLEEESVDKRKIEMDWTGWTDYCPKDSPQQNNGSDCGVFTICTIEQLSRRSPPFLKPMMPFANSQRNLNRSSAVVVQEEAADEDEEPYRWNFSAKNMPYLRRRIVYELVKAELLDY